MKCFYLITRKLFKGRHFSLHTRFTSIFMILERNQAFYMYNFHCIFKNHEKFDFISLYFCPCCFYFNFYPGRRGGADVFGFGGKFFWVQGKYFENGYWIKQQRIINFYREKIYFYFILMASCF